MTKTKDILDGMTFFATEIVDKIATKYMGKYLAREDMTCEQIREGLEENNCDTTIRFMPEFIEFTNRACDEIGYENTDEENEENND